MNEDMIKELENAIADVKNERKALNEKYRELDNTIKDLERKLDLAKFGKEPSCKDCRYSIGLEFSGDGWHNLCGNPNGTCTCCHSSCNAFNPDSPLTTYIKKHCSGANIEWDDADALKTLGVDIYGDFNIDVTNDLQRKSFEKTKEFIKQYLIFRGNSWND